MAFTVVRIAPGQVLQRNPVVGENQFLVAPVVGPVGLYVTRHGLNVRRVVRVVGNKPEIRQPPASGEIAGNCIEG